jgi:plasmid stability protein
MVRNLPDELVRALKLRAAKRNRSAEQEHREILKAALKGPQRKPLADVLASMPNVGTDADFAREQAASEVPATGRANSPSGRIRRSNPSP